MEATQQQIVPAQGWGILNRFPPFPYFPIYSRSPKCMLVIEYHVHIWQVPPQLSCNDTCQIWMIFKECNMYFCEIENSAYGEIVERHFGNPRPRIGLSWFPVCNTIRLVSIRFFYQNQTQNQTKRLCHAFNIHQESPTSFHIMAYIPMGYTLIIFNVPIKQFSMMRYLIPGMIHINRVRKLHFYY